MKVQVKNKYPPVLVAGCKRLKTRAYPTIDLTGESDVDDEPKPNKATTAAQKNKEVIPLASLPFTPSQPKKRQRLPSTQSPKRQHLPPLSQYLSPLSPLTKSLSLTQLSPGHSLQLSPGHSLALSQLSPSRRLPLIQLSPGRSPLLRRPMLTMVQAIIRNVDEAMKHTSTCTNAQLTRALDRAVTSAQQLRDAILAADL